ncbi:hypothetical protein cypCar_00048538 [Cyprinus carpio]|nr:hypothetical protein cypCar_00048538 [Cyprinus carpio]
MGCTSAKQLSSVPSDEEGRGKAYSNGDAFSGQCPSCVILSVLYSFCLDEYRLKGVEKVKYMHGEEECTNTQNQETLVKIDT